MNIPALHYTPEGYLVISPGDDPRRIVDVMLETGYDKEFCVSLDFRPEFLCGLIAAGFLIMSAQISVPEEEPFYLVLPKLHLVRSALFFENLHIKKSIRRYLGQYRLCPDIDFEYIIDRCIAIHGSAWLTPPLIGAVKTIRTAAAAAPRFPVRPTSFALYHGEKLVAGEFGIQVGRVYTSYSGYYDEANAGTVQIIRAAQYLRDAGFDFFDLGMPLDYKTDLGAVDISPAEFVSRFRAATV